MKQPHFVSVSYVSLSVLGFSGREGISLAGLGMGLLSLKEDSKGLEALRMEEQERGGRAEGFAASAAIA